MQHIRLEELREENLIPVQNVRILTVFPPSIQNIELLFHNLYLTTVFLAPFVNFSKRALSNKL